MLTLQRGDLDPIHSHHPRTITGQFVDAELWLTVGHLDTEDDGHSRWVRNASDLSRGDYRETDLFGDFSPHCHVGVFATLNAAAGQGPVLRAVVSTRLRLNSLPDHQHPVTPLNNSSYSHTLAHAATLPVTSDVSPTSARATAPFSA